MDSWVASDQVRALSSGEAELYGIVDARGCSARGIFTKAHVRRVGANHRGGRRDGLHGSDRDVFPNGRWKDKTHPASMAVDPRRHSLQSRAFEEGDWHWERGRHGNQRPRRTYTPAPIAKLPLKPTQCRHLLCLIATASGGSVAEAQVAGDEGDLWTFSAQATIATLVASLTRVLWSALRQARLCNTAVLVRTVERGTQSEHNPVDPIVIPTSVYCSPGDEC